MSVGGYVRRKVFWAQNKDILFSYQECKRIINSGLESLPEVEEKLKRLLEHAINTTIYYSNFDLNSGISSFPIIDKSTIIENRELMFSKEYEQKTLHIMKTSGSTGVPFKIQQNLEKRKSVIAEIKVFNDYAGYPSHEKMMYILGAARNDRSFSQKQQIKENIYRIPVAVNDFEKMKEIALFISKKKPWAIHASASNLPPIVNFLIQNTDYYTGSVRTIITGGEMVPIELREQLEKVFYNSKVIVKYSNEEMGILGQDSGINTPYQLNWANYWFEIFKIDADEPCEYGEIGRIIITDLNNYATPMIRYDTGDIGSLEIINDKEWPVLTNLSGKKRDLIYSTSGDSISGPAITNVFKNVKNVSMYQLVQNGEKDYQYIIVPHNGIKCTNEDIMLSNLYDLLGNDANIEVVFSNDVITTASGKRRYTVNNYKPS